MGIYPRPGFERRHSHSLALWIYHVHQGLYETYAHYPLIAYGTDWLAFGHLMIAVACIGPLRGIPFFLRLIDCSFGVFGILPLCRRRRDIDELGRIEAAA